MCPEIPICLLRSCKRRRERSRVFLSKNNEQTFIGTFTDAKLQKKKKQMHEQRKGENANNDDCATKEDCTFL